MMTAGRFAREYHMPLDTVNQLIRLADQAKTCNEHYTNGDPILVAGTEGRRFDKITDKNEASKLWEAKVDETTELIKTIVTPYGFTGVEYTGLRPCLKHGPHFVEIPTS